MFKYLITLGIVINSFSLIAQNLTDSFESYTVNSYLGPQSPLWSTWSGTEGDTQDVKVVNTKAHSGTKSIYFSSNRASGGPSDVVLPFNPTSFSVGYFTFSMWMFVETNKAAYFNFQGSNGFGSSFPLNVSFYQDGKMKLYTSQRDLLNTTYPQNTWFEIKLIGSLNNAKWVLEINNVKKGTVYLSETSLYALDLYPVNNSPNSNNQSGFYVDDIKFDYTPFIIPPRNGALSGIDLPNGLQGYKHVPKLALRNLGFNQIDSLVITSTYGTNTVQKKFKNLFLTSFSPTILTLDSITLQGGTKNYTAILSDINGMGFDNNTADDTSGPIELVAMIPNVNKVIVSEDATGTWGQWSPRSAVFQDYMSKKYGNKFIGIAVHNNDPMMDSMYNQGMQSLVSGYPSSIVDRFADIDPNAVENAFIQRISMAPKGKLSINGMMNTPSNGKLKVTVNTEFLKDTSGIWKLAVVLVEDSVTGITNGYNQANAYSGSLNGVMGGYEILANPVPANKMIYQQVARKIVPSFTGKTDAYPTTIANGSKHVTDFIIDINPAWNYNNLSAIAMLITPDGKIENGMKRKVNTFDMSSLKNVNLANEIKLYPNPSHDISFLNLTLTETTAIKIVITDITGHEIAKNNFEGQMGEIEIPIITQNLPKGMYTISAIFQNHVITKKLIVE